MDRCLYLVIRLVVFRVTSLIIMVCMREITSVSIVGLVFAKISHHIWSIPTLEMLPNQEAFMMNAYGKLHLGFYFKGEADPSSAYGETHGHEKGWGLQQQLNPYVEEVKKSCSWSWKIK
ncbi:hypothetical protein GQ457_15G022760 [Hibiscus cannabinus]